MSEDKSKQWLLYDPKVYYKQEKSDSQSSITTDEVLSEIEGIRQEVGERCEQKPGNSTVKVPVVDGTESNTIVATAEKANDAFESEATQSTDPEDSTRDETPGTNDSDKISALTALLGKPGAKPATSLEFPLYDPGVYYKPEGMQATSFDEANDEVLAVREELLRLLIEDQRS